LRDSFSIYYAEAFGIIKAIEYVRDNDLKNVCIVNDSSRVLLDIKKFNLEYSSHPLLISTICSYLKIFQHLTLTWFPGHCENINILFTDKSAKSAARDPNPPPFIEYSTTEAIGVVEEWIRSKWCKEWEDNPKCTYQTVFKLQRTTINYTLTRRAETAISRLRLQQTKLNWGKFKLGLHYDGCCESCGIKQDGEHFVMKCNETQDLREQLITYQRSLAKPITWSYSDLISYPETVGIIAKYIVINNIEV